MPTDALTLKTRYQALVAPGNDTAFFRLLTEADERLLFAGRWHWAREPLSLAVASNLVTLPAAYHSIVGARINGAAVGVNWQESEWFEGGPGEFIPIDGASAFLVDQGIVSSVDPASSYSVSGTLTDGSNPVVFPELLPTESALVFSSTGSLDIPLTGEWYGWVKATSGPIWIELKYYLDNSLVASWECEQNVATPDLSTIFTAVNPADGTPSIAITDPVTSYTRTFKLTSSNTDIVTVDVLARFKPAVITDETGSAFCPLPSALKQMMYAIVYEEANDTKLSEEYRAKALRELAEHEAAYRGIAKRVFKPSMFRPAKRRSRHNFP